MDEYDVETSAHTRYQVDCGDCGEVFDEMEGDPVGEILVCDACGARNRVYQTI